MTLAWYLNRLRNMQPAEIVHRLHEKRKRLASRTRDEGWERYPAMPLHFVFGGVAASLRAATAAQRGAISAAAADLLAGNFSALGRAWPKRSPEALFPPELWRLDPVSSQTWPGPDTYTFDIDFRHGGARGDIKLVWEINRLQVLVVLAAHEVLAPADGALRAIEAAVASWHAANPPFRGVGWASGIEVALRAISLILVLDLVGDRLSATIRRMIGEILAASAWWLPRFPSRFSSANNHLVAELAGEYLIGMAFGREPTAVRRALLDEIDKQILPDGVGAEQTPTYAAFTAELSLFCALAARNAGHPFPQASTERLLAFAGWIDWLGPPTPRLGDDDEGRVVTLGQEADYARSVAAAVCGFFGRPGPVAETPDLRALIFGVPSAAARRPAGLRSFPQGGMSVWRGQLAGREVSIGFDHGPLGYLSIAAHGHADALALTLTLDGEPVLVDPGTFLYKSGGAWRDWFRSTPAHNTLNIQGESQSTMVGPFNWSHKARAELTNIAREPDWLLEGQHDGYRRHGVLHRRTLQRRGEALAVIDSLLGGPLRAEIVFQLAPGLSATAEGSVVAVHRGAEPWLTIEFPDAAVSLAAGGETPGAGGWVSPHFGTKLPATRLAWRGVVGDLGVSTILTPAS
ncbi:MAG TPA: heparinase II/III-family protein [Devosiaceae bacterium]|nr:heparinase II/III-family protein [Devosiaceae bacterium]